MPAPSAAQPDGKTVTIFGRKISYDALLLAGASLVGIIFMYKIGQAGGQPMVSIDPNAGSAGDFAAPSTQPPLPPPPTNWGGPGATYPVTNPQSSSTIQTQGQPSPGQIIQWQGTEGSSGGPNTTGRSSGSQIYSGSDSTDNGGGGYGGHADTSGTSTSSGGSGSGGHYNPPPPNTVPGPPPGSTGGQIGSGGGSNQTGRSSGGQIFQ